MPINVDSTTDSEENLTAANAAEVKQENEVEEKKTKSDPADGEQLELKADEKKESEDSAEDSDASESEEENESEDEQEESEDEAKGDDKNEDDESEEDEDQLKKKSRSKRGFKKRIAKLSNKLSEKDKEIEYLKKQLFEGKKPDDVNDSKQAKGDDQESDAKPVADDFETHEDYIEALTDWKLEQKLSAQKAKEKETQVQSEHQKAVKAHIDRVEEFRESHEDFDEVIEDASDIQMSVAVQQLIIESENGPELMYELSKDPDELERICSLPPMSAAREFGKFETRIMKSSEPKKEAKEIKTTKAPKPIKPVGAKASGSGKKDIYDPNLSQAEFERLRQEQLSNSY